MTSNPPQRAEIMEVDERETCEDHQSVTSHPTEIARSHTQGSVLFAPVGFIARQREQSGSPARSLTRHTKNRIQRIEKILGRFDPTLPTASGSPQPDLSFISVETLQMAEELDKVKAQLAAGVQIIGQELERVDKTMNALDVETQRVQKEFAMQVAQWLEAADSRQLRYEEVTLQLHGAVQTEGQQAMQRDLMLDQELQRVDRKHKEEMARLQKQLLEDRKSVV